MNKEQAIAAHTMRVEMGEFTSYRLTCNLGDDAECHQTCETHPEGGCGMEEETCVKKVYSGGCVIAEWVNDGGIESVGFEHTVEFPIYYEWLEEFPTILAAQADEVETVEAIKVGDVIHADWWGDETHPDLTVVSVVTYLEVRDWRGLEHIGPLGGARLSQGGK